MIKEEKSTEALLNITPTIDNFFDMLKCCMAQANENNSYRYFTSRSTEENTEVIQKLCSDIEDLCKLNLIPIKGAFLQKNELSIKTFKYLVCNTCFTCQSLLADDPTVGCLVNKVPPIPIYLLIEILWHIQYEEILAESILYFPLDLCIEILEILPRCIDLLDFQRASKFLSTLVLNTYKKLILLKDTGTQTQDINGNARKLAGNLQELLLQFTNDRFLKLEGIKQTEQYKRYGILLKKIVQMVRMCLTTKFKKIELPCDMAEMYKLTFGQKPLEKIDEQTLQELLTEIDQELINLLSTKVKEIDCNIYMDWTEYDDEENTSLTLQRAIGLECYFFIENTKEFKNLNIQEYEHLVQCLQQIASKPDPQNSIESLQLEDLCRGAQEGRKECLLALFQRYKEWDNSTIDSIDSSIASLSKDDCERLFEHLVKEFTNPQEQLDKEKLQLYTLCLGKALAHLNITELYEVTIKFILKFSENSNLENAVDISNFEKFIMLNPNFSSPKNLRVVLFFLCLKTRETLKILLKMAIGHSDYPDVAVSLDDLIVLLPVLKIQTKSKCGTIIEALRIKYSEKDEGRVHPFIEVWPNQLTPPETVTFAVQILQEICLETPGWNASKFSNLLQMLYSFCNVTEVLVEIFIPFLLSSTCSITYLKYILLELHKIKGHIPLEIGKSLGKALEAQALYLLTSNHVSRYVVDELLTLIIDLMKHLLKYFNYTLNDSPYLRIFIYSHNIHNPTDKNSLSKCLPNRIDYIIRSYANFHQSMLTDITKYPLDMAKDDIIRHLFLKCTKQQYLLFSQQIIDSSPNLLDCTGKSNICDNLIRLTLETCLFCLEFPEACYPDSIGFLIRCLLHLLPSIPIDAKKANKFHRDLCNSLNTHLAILKPSIERTALSHAYDKLIKQCEESKLNFGCHMSAFEQFALSSMHESEKLQTFEGPHTPLGIKLWLAHDIITKAMEKSVSHEAYMEKLGGYFEARDS